MRAPAFLTLHFAPGECAQVDWGHYGSVNVGNTRRRLSFFVMVLCYSRLMYVEFTVSQTMETTLLNLGRHFSIDRKAWPLLCERIKELLSGPVGTRPRTPSAGVRGRGTQDHRTAAAASG